MRSLRHRTIFFEKGILDFYKKQGRHALPWRKKEISAYEVWVSEIMLQQTQVARVISYYERFLRKFPNVSVLASASWKQFLPYYAGLGYYRRGENMLKTARIIVSDFGGVFPQKREVLLSLPGVGEYTASAILSFAFGKRELAIDTNLKKVFGRFFEGSKDVVIDMRKILPFFHTSFRTLNAAFMDFSNIVCKKKPLCDMCPLRNHCAYSRAGGRKEISVTRANSRFPTKDARVHLWLHKKHQEYYSLNEDQFEPFVLPRGVVTREDIKKYFLEKFGLHVAVRPPHKKIFLDDMPVLFVNAQILLGDHEFAVYSKKEI